jgi:hypothetical protein
MSRNISEDETKIQIEQIIKTFDFENSVRLYNEYCPCYKEAWGKECSVEDEKRTAAQLLEECADGKLGNTRCTGCLMAIYCPHTKVLMLLFCPIFSSASGMSMSPFKVGSFPDKEWNPKDHV